MIDLDKIEREALAAKEKHPGPWAFSWGDGGVVEMHARSFSRIVSCEDEGSLSHPEVMGPYFARCHPDTLLALVARICELQRDKNLLEMKLRDAIQDNETDSYESYKAGRRESADAWRGVHFNCPGCARMLRNQAP